jgi:hypothetical protein
MGRPKTATPKIRRLSVRLDGADGEMFDELLRRRRRELGASDQEYTDSMFVRAVIRKLAEEAAILPTASNGASKPKRARSKAA